MKILADPTFTTPVKLTVAGQEHVAEISVTWKHHDRDWLKEWAVRALAAGEDGMILCSTEAAWLDEVIASWSGPVDAKGVAVPYSVGSLTLMLQQHATAGREFYNQYLRAISESRVKN